MKAGTTTVFEDLQTQPQIFFPVHKEPHNLCFDTVLGDAGLARYVRLFRRARPDQLCGEASTGYTKLPVYQGVPERARQVLGPNLRIIYSVREPVARSLSHHLHLHLAGEASADFEETLQHRSELIDFSRYAMQIDPWIETFGRQRIHIVQLERYADDRREGLRELCTFLGVEPQAELVQESKVFRAAKDKRRIPSWLAGPLQKVTSNHWYRYTLRPLIPDNAITRLKKTLFKPPPQLPPPRPAVIDQIVDTVRDDAERLRQIMGRDEPLWDFDAVRAKYVRTDQRAEAAV